MMKTKQVRLTAILAMIVLLISVPLSISAKADGSAPSTIGFTVQANIPENQIDNNSTYFDLMVSPGQTQDLSVTIQNTSEEEIQVKVEANQASTNRNGVIEYKADVEPDESLILPFSTIAKVKDPVLTIPAGTSKDAIITVAMPEGKAYDGIVLGGLVFTKINEEKEDTQNSAQISTAVENIYSYIIGVKLTETNTLVLPEFNLTNAYPDLVNYRPSVTGLLQNSQAALVKDLTLTSSLYKDGATTPLYEDSATGLSVAPNSVFPYTLGWKDGIKLSPGNYTLKVLLEDPTDSWNLEYSFTVDGDQLAEIKSNSVVEAPTQTVPQWVIFVIIGAVILLLIVAVLVILLLKKNKKENN